MTLDSCQPAASHFVDGNHVEDRSGAAFDCVNPATGEVIARLHEATDQIVERALSSARSAQAHWAALEPRQRGRVLRRAADIIRDRNEELSLLETLNTGKPISETRVADAASGADCLEYFGCLAPTLTGDQIPLGQDWPIRSANHLASVLGSGPGTIPSRSPAGRQRLRWPAAMP